LFINLLLRLSILFIDNTIQYNIRLMHKSTADTAATEL